MGVLFLVSGLLVTVLVTISPASANTLQSTPSVWVELANSIMDFTIQLLSLEWTPARVGIFLILVGMVLEGAGAYSLMTANP